MVFKEMRLHLSRIAWTLHEKVSPLIELKMVLHLTNDLTLFKQTSNASESSES